MAAKKGFKNGLYGMIGMMLLFHGLSAPAAVTKLKVTYVPGAPIYKTAALGQPIATLPLNSILDSEVKQGEYWKVTFQHNGIKTTGFVHELLVEEVSESDIGGAADPVGSVRTQSELAAQIENRIEDNRTIIRQRQDLAQAVESLRSLLAKVFGLEDLQRQKQMACDIYLLIGHALSNQGDDFNAIKEYRNMFEVDFLTAKKATKYVSESTVSNLIGIAERQYKGTFVNYTLHIDTEPKEAVIKINGEVIGRTPDVHTTENPRLTVEIEKEGFAPVKESLFLTETVTKKSYTLQSLGRVLNISSSPPGAVVFLDGKDTGKATDCELPHVPYGPHTLKMKKENYADWEEGFTVSEGTGPLSKTAVLTVSNYAHVRAWGTPANKVFIQPRALAFDKSGNYYVADESPTKLRKYNPEGRFIKSWGSEGQQFKPLKQPAGIAIDGQGNFYVTDARSANVTKFDKNGQKVNTWGKLGTKEGELSQPLGIAVDRNNDILVVDAANNRIVRYSSDGIVKKTWGKPGFGQGQFSLPTGVAVNSRNEVIVVDQGRIQKFSSDGVFIEAYGKPGSGEGELRRPLGVCLDKDDNIYVADGGNNRILKFASSGRFIVQLGSSGPSPGQFLQPIGITVNEKGSIFVIEKENCRIQEFQIPSK